MSESSAPRPIEAVIFDLYGTLLESKRPRVHKDLPRALGASRREWMPLVRRELLTRSFSDAAHFLQHIYDALGKTPTPETQAECEAMVDEELGAIEPVEGVRSLLAFLRHRGLRLGLLSNLTSLHKEPIARFELDSCFDAVSLSCDEGRAKPDPELYRGLCAKLGVGPEQTLFVGDSLANDVRAPTSLGMPALHIGPPGDRPGLARVNELGWRHLACTNGAVSAQPLLVPEQQVRLGPISGPLGRLEPLSDDEQGRYNLVARSTVDGREVFCKRFLFPEAAYVEELAHQVLELSGIPSCDVAVHSDPEPCLIVSKAPGHKLARVTEPAVAREFGRHGAAAYVFANADLRPRNAFVALEGDRAIVTMIDLEHCFFNLALDVEGIDDPRRPESFDLLSAEELAARLRRRVLTERTTKRAMRTFLELDSPDGEMAQAFREGWIGAYRAMSARRNQLRELLEDRVHRGPFLIIGTRSYRRAMAQPDVEDIIERLKLDPEELFPKVVAFA